MSNYTDEDNNSIKSLFIINQENENIEHFVSVINERNKNNKTHYQFIIVSYDKDGKLRPEDIEKIKEYTKKMRNIYFYGFKEKKLNELYVQLNFQNIELTMQNITPGENKSFVKLYAKKKHLEKIEKAKRSANQEMWQDYIDSQHEEMYGIDVGKCGIAKNVEEDFENRGFDVGSMGTDNFTENDVENYYGEDIFTGTHEVKNDEAR